MKRCIYFSFITIIIPVIILKIAFPQDVLLSGKEFFDIYVNFRHPHHYLSYFPEYQLKFQNTIQKIDNLGDKLHQLYIQKNIKKEIRLSDVSKEYKNILYKLHGIYINEKTIITREVVINYIYELPIGYIVKLLKVK